MNQIQVKPIPICEFIQIANNDPLIVKYMNREGQDLLNAINLSSSFLKTANYESIMKRIIITPGYELNANVINILANSRSTVLLSEEAREELGKIVKVKINTKQLDKVLPLQSKWIHKRIDDVLPGDGNVAYSGPFNRASITEVAFRDGHVKYRNNISRKMSDSISTFQWEKSMVEEDGNVIVALIGDKLHILHYKAASGLVTVPKSDFVDNKAIYQEIVDYTLNYNECFVYDGKGDVAYVRRSDKKKDSDEGVEKKDKSRKEGGRKRKRNEERMDVVDDNALMNNDYLPLLDELIAAANSATPAKMVEEYVPQPFIPQEDVQCEYGSAVTANVPSNEHGLMSNEYG